MKPVPDLSTIKIVEVPGIEPVTSWSVVRHATPRPMRLLKLQTRYKFMSCPINEMIEEQFSKGKERVLENHKRYLIGLFDTVSLQQHKN